MIYFQNFRGKKQNYRFLIQLKFENYQKIKKCKTKLSFKNKTEHELCKIPYCKIVFAVGILNPLRR